MPFATINDTQIFYVLKGKTKGNTPQKKAKVEVSGSENLHQEVEQRKIEFCEEFLNCDNMTRKSELAEAEEQDKVEQAQVPVLEATQPIETVAFLSGIAMSTDSWGQQTASFGRRYQILLHDLRGQGKSLYTGDLTFAQHAQDLKALLDQLHIEKIHVVGISYGAKVGIYFALMYPERVYSLTLGTAPSECRPLLKAMLEAWITAASKADGTLLYKTMAPLVYGESYLESNREWLDRRALIFSQFTTDQWFEGFIAMCRNVLTLHITDRLHEITAPVLIITGANDLLVPGLYAEILKREIPHAESVTVENAGHAIYLEQPAIFNDTILDFLQKQSNKKEEFAKRTKKTCE